MSEAALETLPAGPQVQRHVPLRFALVLPLIPALLVVTVLFAYPVLVLLTRSFQANTGGWSLESYERIFEHRAYFHIMVNTLWMSAESTLVTLILGYPLAYLLTKVRASVAALLVALISVPYFTSSLVRTYAWIVLLGTGGVLNQSLVSLNIPGAPYRLMYTELGVIIGLSYVLLPFMVLVLYSVMSGIDGRLLQAAASVGASPLRAFIKVYIPLTLPGVVAGCLLTFIQAIGAYITPALMGGLGQTVLATVIQQNINRLDQWNFAAALAVMLLVVTAGTLVLFDRLVGINRLFEAKW